MTDDSLELRQQMRAGASNLLRNCIDVRAGSRVAVVREQSSFDYYDEAAPDCVVSEARRLGATVIELTCDDIDGPDNIPSSLRDAMIGADHVLFFHRLGDRLRFADLPGAGSKTMCYSLDAETLGSRFCTTPFGLLQDVLESLDAWLGERRHWRITCEHGTDVCGETVPRPTASDAPAGFTIGLFPATIIDPIDAGTMEGRFTLMHWLMATGNRRYEPFALMLDEPVTAVVSAGRIERFEGASAMVKKVEAHYQHVAKLFDIDPYVVHSWHAGVNPHTAYARPARNELERWGGITFASPRYLHVHTCGDYPPGEIAWSVFDATVEVDGEVVWDRGRLAYLDRPEMLDLLDRYGATTDAYVGSGQIGI